MYALLIGIKAKNRLDFNRSEGTKFLNIGAWKPREITEYIFMSLLVLVDFSFEEIENLNDEQADDKANALLHLMEGYAKGGFEIINNKRNDDPNYFQDPLNVVGFLKQVDNLL